MTLQMSRSFDISRSNLAIVVENIGKRYRIGLEEERPDTLIGTLSSWVKKPVKNLSQLRQLRRFSGEDGEDILWALRGVSFEVNRGEVVGIIGPNGSGKSTLLKLLSRITSPSEGRIVMQGRVSSLLEVGTGFHPELSGQDNVYLNAAILGMSKAEVDQQYEAIVEFSGIRKFMSTPVKRYSSGMRLRLAFAVAAHLDPEILLIDEVLAVGDLAFRDKCLGKMDEITKAGRTVLFVSHQMAAIESLCDRCLLLEGGRLEADGPVDTVISEYVSRSRTTKSRVELPVEDDKTFASKTIGAALMPMDGKHELNYDCGDDIRFECEVSLTSAIEKLSIGLLLETLEGQTIVGMSSLVQCVDSKGGPASEWRVNCDMGAIPLNSGIYAVHVYIGDGSRDIARIMNAATIHIHEKDITGWGRGIPGRRSWGCFYWRPKWQIDSEFLGAQHQGG